MLLPTALIGVLGLLRSTPDTVDDAYITFRAVKNFVEGTGLSFNPGTYVESFSNPLMVFLLIPAVAAGISPGFAAFLIGMISFVACAVAVSKLVYRDDMFYFYKVAAGASVIGCFPLLYYSITGLETGLFAALIICMVWRFAVAQRVDWLVALLLAGIAYCRPEGIAYVVAMTAALFFLPRRPDAKELALCAGVFLVFAGGLLLRKWYYGAWLPNTFLAKPPGTGDLDPGTGRFLSALPYLGEFILRMGVLIPLLAFYQRLEAENRIVVIPLLAMAATGLMFAVYTGGDWFPAGRYLLPVAPVLIALGFLSASQMWKTHGRKLAAAMLATSLVGSTYTLGVFMLRHDQYPYHVMHTKDIRAAALEIRDTTPVDAKIAAFRIGALGYYGERHIIDLHGLADREIARIISRTPAYSPSVQLGNDTPAIREYLRQQRPYAVLAVNSANLGNPPALPFYGFDYRLAKVFPQGADQNWLMYVYTEREDPAPAP